MKIELRIRNLKTREGGQVTFLTEAEALMWLKTRPTMVEVMGTAGQGTLPKDLEDRLRAAVRPLDAEEKVAEQEADLAAAKENLAREQANRAKEMEDQKAHNAAMANADPERLMEVHWRFDKDMAPTDAHDPRPLTAEAREAVLAWIAERNEWVAGRGQCVGECTVKVWPGKLPKGESERVKEGRFFPVSAEEKS